jgi:hypothetical protein
LPLRASRRLIVGFLLASACIDGPVLVITSGRALKAIFVGMGVNTRRATLLVQTHLDGNTLYAVSRVLPVAAAITLALWIRQRHASALRDPVILLSLVAASLTFRLVFEVNLWGYYFMAVTVVLIVCQALQCRVNWFFVLWLVIVTYAAIDGGLANRPALAPWPMSLWQAVLIPWALALACEPLRALLQEERHSMTRVEHH